MITLTSFSSKSTTEWVNSVYVQPSKTRIYIYIYIYIYINICPSLQLIIITLTLEQHDNYDCLYHRLVYRIFSKERPWRSFKSRVLGWGAHSKVALFLSFYTLQGYLFDSYMSSTEAKFNFILSFFKILITNSQTKWKTNCYLCLYWA